MGFSGAILTILIVVIIWCYYWTAIHPNLDSEKLDILLKEKRFKTGDLILFKATDNFNAPFIASYYGHIGIVYVYPDDPEKTPYIFEAANPTNMALEDHENPRGIFISLLENRVKQYKGYSFYKELGNSIDPKICLEFETFINYCISNMEYDTGVVSNGIKKGLFGEKSGLKTNCGELVFLSLIKLDLLPLSSYDSPTYHHLRWMCSVENLENGNYYKEPLKIVYSPF